MSHERADAAARMSTDYQDALALVRSKMFFIRTGLPPVNNDEALEKSEFLVESIFTRALLGLGLKRLSEALSTTELYDIVHQGIDADISTPRIAGSFLRDPKESLFAAHYAIGTIAYLQSVGVFSFTSTVYQPDNYNLGEIEFVETRWNRRLDDDGLDSLLNHLRTDFRESLRPNNTQLPRMINTAHFLLAGIEIEQKLR